MSFSRFIRSGLGALLLAAFFVAAPASAQSVNPTAQSVKEEQLLQALKPGEQLSGRISIPDPKAASLIQSGRDWRAFNQETLHKLGMWSFLGMLGALVVFYVVRGKIRIDAGPSRQRILRFNTVERFAHWLSAVSFIILAITGANVTFGKLLLAPVMGPEAFAAWAQYAKYIHNYVGFAFMAGVFLVFLVWVKDNIPNAVDVRWFAAGGGLLSKGHHPPAKRFNGGQKIVFWSVVIGGFLLSLSGWYLLFPYSTTLADVQWYATIHGVAAFVMIALMLAHAYIGSIGMEGAFDAMGSGEVDLNWAKEHHSLWVEEEMRAGKLHPHAAGQPAE
ncbi:MAG: formate dehydrogenase subunit gamma [Beijerinckiaceae bacterium]|jgi:formate dehydrogenase subunit gamma|nr:formate dehydrogenase subunit gamma [Beijerinckiaceae bacterium]